MSENLRFKVVTKMWNPQNGFHWNLNPILWNVELPKMWNFHRYHILTCVRVRIIHFKPLTLMFELLCVLFDLISLIRTSV